MLAQNLPNGEDDAADELWSLADFADFLSITDRSARGLIAEGKIPAYRVAGKRLIRVRKRDVMALLEPIPTTNAT